MVHEHKTGHYWAVTTCLLPVKQTCAKSVFHGQDWAMERKPAGGLDHETEWISKDTQDVAPGVLKDAQ